MRDRFSHLTPSVKKIFPKKGLRLCKLNLIVRLNRRPLLTKNSLLKVKGILHFKIHLWGRSAVLALLAAIGFFIPAPVSACGLNWSNPGSHFEGVSFQGYVFLVENLGEVDAGRGMAFPLRALFRSESSTTSPYLGAGWDIPLLESHIIQVDENHFRMVEPTGWYRMFWRDRKNPHLLHGQNGWKAEIKANQITAWADCGVKLIFHKGRITSMQIQEREFIYSYEGSRVLAIKEGGIPIISVETEINNRKTIGLRLSNNQLIQFKKSKRPQVQIIGGKNFIEATVESLSAIVLKDGDERFFDYSLNENLHPTISTNKRKFTWDSISKKIIEDEAWKYNINSASDFYKYAEIARVNKKGEKESWFNDKINGVETVERIDGTKQISTWFISGPLAGRKRERYEIDKDKNRKLIYRYSYNEVGDIVFFQRN